MRFSPLVRLVAAAGLLLQLLCGSCRGESKCYTCDNYFELNLRNLDTATKDSVQRRFCSEQAHLTDSHQGECTGVDYDGCVKIVTRSYRHHIDRIGLGMRQAETLIATVITRDCATIPPGMGLGCHLTYGAGTTTEMCYCQGEYCNSARRIGPGYPPLLLLLLPVSVLLLLTLWSAV